jgi:hypothetical protein
MPDTVIGQWTAVLSAGCAGCLCPRRLLDPVQPLAHKGTEKALLFCGQTVFGPVKHRMRRSEVVLERRPGSLIPTE